MSEPPKTDIVDRLMDYDHCHDDDVDEAAAEIERLRSENRLLQGQLEGLDAVLTALRRQLSQSRERERKLREACVQMEAWWLDEGMKHFHGAPAAIYAIRQALAETAEGCGHEG